VGLGRLDTGIVGLNPAQGLDICPRLCCAILCRQRSCDRLITCARSPTKYLNRFIISEVILNWNRPQGLIRKSWWWGIQAENKCRVMQHGTTRVDWRKRVDWPSNSRMTGDSYCYIDSDSLLLSLSTGLTPTVADGNSGYTFNEWVCGGHSYVYVRVCVCVCVCLCLCVCLYRTLRRKTWSSVANEETMKPNNKNKKGNFRLSSIPHVT
jgi:hypothetical protein